MQETPASKRPPETALVAAKAPGASTDIAECTRILKEGSKSFAAASLLLPARVRGPAAATYAFCRVADDLIDLGDDQDEGLRILHERLDAIYAGLPADDPVDRAFAEVVAAFDIPKEVPLALFEGFEWDARGRRYETLEDLLAYCARVASTVGVMMTLIMGKREPVVLARASDLGLAMQLTNICRDVGEDARAGRLYLPRQLLRQAGVDAERFLEEPVLSDGIKQVVGQLLEVARGFYVRADHGIRMLPLDCRVSIRAARLIYSDIGTEIEKHGRDSISYRAHTSKARKLWLVFRSLGSLFWRSANTNEPSDESTRFLIAATSSSGALKPSGASS